MKNTFLALVAILSVSTVFGASPKMRPSSIRPLSRVVGVSTAEPYIAAGAPAVNQSATTTPNQTTPRAEPRTFSASSQKCIPPLRSVAGNRSIFLQSMDYQ